MIIVRENIEDLYAGIEHMQTQDVAQCLKIITRKGSEKIIRYAFELARREGRAEGHLRHQGQHHEAHRGPLQADLRGARRRVPGDHGRAPDHRQRRPPDGQEPGPVRRRRHHEPQRRHHQRPRLGAGRRPGLRAVGQLRRRRGDLRGGPRLGPEVRRQGRHQPDRADPLLAHDAAPRRRGRRGRPRSRTRSSSPSRRGRRSPRTWPARPAATWSTRRRRRASPTRSSRTSAGSRRRSRRAPASERPSGEATPRPRWTYGAEVSAARRPARRSASTSSSRRGSRPTRPARRSRRSPATRSTLQMISSRGTMVYPEHGPHARQRGPAAGAVRRPRGTARASPTPRSPRSSLRVGERFAWTHVEKLHVFAGEDGFTKAQGQ